MTSRASIYIQAYNRHNEPNRATSEYSNHRLTDDGYWEHGIEVFPPLHVLLRETADLVMKYGDDPATMADVYSFLHNAQRDVTCMAWVFYETYVEEGSTWDGRRGLKGACLTEEQATAFMEAEHAFWQAHRSQHRVRNTWAVAYEEIEAHWVWEPDFTVDQFKDDLRRCHT